MRAYYAQHAQVYERVYHKPERQADLRAMEAWLAAPFAGRRVLEVACGTGYWTPLIAARAKSVLAVDYAVETLEIARSKTYEKQNVDFQQGDAYDLPAWPQKFSGSYAGFWWSHIPLEKIDSFLAGLHERLAPGVVTGRHPYRLHL